MAVLAVLLLSLAALVGLAPAASAANDPTRATLLVHGIDLNPADPTPRADCAGEFGDMSRSIISSGLRTSVVTVGYYQADRNCSVNLHTYGRARNADYPDFAVWKDMAKAMSWYVYDAWTARGVKVDIVGYSMGGLIARGAIYGSQIGEPGFAPALDVGNAVTLGTPFNGGSWWKTALCAAVLGQQCASLAPNSTELQWLNGSNDAQGKYSTLWTIFGSTADALVPAESATHMKTWPDRAFVLNNIYHADQPSYTHADGVIRLVKIALGGQTSRIYARGTTNKCLDVKYMSTAYGTPVQSYDCGGTYAQIWTRERTGQTGQIAALGMCLDISGARFTNGTLVQLWGCNNSLGQLWTQYSDGTIRSNGYCLAALNNNWSNFAQLVIWTCNGGPGELWS